MKVEQIRAERASFLPYQLALITLSRANLTLEAGRLERLIVEGEVSAFTPKHGDATLGGRIG